MTSTAPHAYRAARRAALLGCVLLGAFGCAPRPTNDLPTYVLFFTAFSADLDSPAQGVVREAAAAAKANPSGPVTVAGYADRIGSPAANVTLSKLRAQVVSDALVAAGVPQSRIVQQPKGPQGDPGIESRRVEIDIGY